MQQFYIATEPTYIAEIVKGCGFDITAPNDRAEDSGWSRISSETLIDLKPSSILYLAKDSKDAEEVTQHFKQNYTMMDAIKNNSFFVYDDPHITIPGPFIFKEQEKICELLRHND